MIDFPKKILVTIWHKDKRDDTWRKHKLLYQVTNHSLNIDLDETNDERTHIENIEFIY